MVGIPIAFGPPTEYAGGAKVNVLGTEDGERRAALCSPAAPRVADGTWLASLVLDRAPRPTYENTPSRPPPRCLVERKRLAKYVVPVAVVPV